MRTVVETIRRISSAGIEGGGGWITICSFSLKSVLVCEKEFERQQQTRFILKVFLQDSLTHRETFCTLSPLSWLECSDLHSCTVCSGEKLTQTVDFFFFFAQCAHCILEGKCTPHYFSCVCGFVFVFFLRLPCSGDQSRCAVSRSSVYTLSVCHDPQCTCRDDSSVLIIFFSTLAIKGCLPQRDK